MPSFATCRLATPADDPALRRILRETHFDGNISLSFEREPNYFNAAAISGPFHQTMVVCEQESGDVMGMGDRSARPLWVNDGPMQVGYFSGFRSRDEYRRGLALARFTQQGFRYYRELHNDGQAPFYIISIVADNTPARRLLTAGLSGLPRLQEYQQLVTYAIHPARPKPPSQIECVRGTSQHLGELVNCLTRNQSRYQFAPCWEKDSLFSPLTPHLAIEDFFLAVSGSRVVGCLALWDQTPLKQTVLRGYSGPLKVWRKALNLLSPLGGWPNLPGVGTPLNQAFACFLALDNDNPNVFAALLRAVYNEAARRHYSYLLLGLADSHPLAPIVQRYRPIKYTSQIYLAAWPDTPPIPTIDVRPCGLEIALL